MNKESKHNLKNPRFVFHQIKFNKNTSNPSKVKTLVIGRASKSVKNS